MTGMAGEAAESPEKRVPPEVPQGPAAAELAELPEAYYLPGPDGTFAPTGATESPWASDAQHGGPPTALLAHVLRTQHDVDGMRIARITNEFLGSIPRVPLTAQATVIRDGRRVRLVEASLLADGKPIAIARAWQIVTSGEGGIPAEGLVSPTAPLLPGPMPQNYFTGLHRWGYGESIEWRWVRGSYDTAGEAVVWARPRIPLVAGQPMHPLERILVVADSANGVSSALSPREWLFIPPAITVTLHRYPEGDWVYLTAVSILAPDGLGSTLGTVGDPAGPIGSVTQPLLVAPQR